MAGSYSSILAKAIQEAKEAAGEAIDLTAEEIIARAITNAKEIIYAAYRPHRYRRRKSFMDENEYFYERNGLEGYVAPRQTPNPEGDPTPSIDKDLPTLIETGTPEDTYTLDIGHYTFNSDYDSPYNGQWYDITHYSQYYDYKAIKPRPWWTETMSNETNKYLLISSCALFLEARGFIVTIK